MTVHNIYYQQHTLLASSMISFCRAASTLTPLKDLDIKGAAGRADMDADLGENIADAELEVAEDKEAKAAQQLS